MSGLYGDQFYQAMREGSARSAAVVVPLVVELLHPASVVDAGCGTGAWLAGFQQQGVGDVLGLEFSTVSPQLAEIDASLIRSVDASQPFRLERSFDLAMSLEVAEHLPEGSAAGFVWSLTRLGPAALFSAAIPGQGGTGHLNEQWPSYWARHFADHGFTVVDCLRDRIWNDPRIEWWYRQNLLLFVANDHLQRYAGLAGPKGAMPAALDRMMPYSLRHPAPPGPKGAPKGAPEGTPAAAPPAAAPTFGVMVLSRNGASRLGHCLESVARQNFAGELVVCVDRETTDDTAAVARRFTPHVHPIETGGTLESALPAMAAHCSAEYVLRLDDDETLGGNWERTPLEALVRGNDLTHLILPRRWLVPGPVGAPRFIACEPWFPDYQVRFFRNDPSLIRWPAAIHDPMEMKGRGMYLYDRWIEHYDLVIHSRPDRERKARHYRRLRPEKHLSNLYLYEEQEIDLLPATAEGYAEALEAYFSGRERRAAEAGSPYRARSEIRFEAGGNGGAYTRKGWSDPEPWGRWTNGYRAELRIPLERPLEGPALLALEAVAYVRAWHPTLHVRVECNRVALGGWVIETSDFVERTLPIPAAALAGKRELLLAFHVDNPASPADSGEFGLDQRLLGLGFRQMRIGTLQ